MIRNLKIILIKLSIINHNLALCRSLWPTGTLTPPPSSLVPELLPSESLDLELELEPYSDPSSSVTPVIPPSRPSFSREFYFFKQILIGVEIFSMTKVICQLIKASFVDKAFVFQPIFE